MVTKTIEVEVRMPRYGWRVALTLVIVAVLSVLTAGYNAVQGSVEGELAVKQLSEDATERAVGRAVAQSNVPVIWNTVGGIAILGIWIPFVVGAIKYTDAKHA